MRIEIWSTCSCGLGPHLLSYPRPLRVDWIEMWSLVCLLKVGEVSSEGEDAPPCFCESVLCVWGEVLVRPEAGEHGRADLV